jgi:hypothetical protein
MFLTWLMISPNKATIIAALIGAAAIIIGAVVTRFRKRPKVTQTVTITDVTEEQHFGNKVERFNLTSLDILLKNVGGKRATVHTFELKVVKVWHLQLMFPTMHYIQTSHTHLVVIDPERKHPYSLEVPTPHGISPDEEDRVSVNIGLKPLKAFESIYHLRCRFVYDQRWKTPPTELILVMPDMSTHERDYLLDDYEAKKATFKAQGLMTGLAKAAFTPIKAAREIDRVNRKMLRAAGKVKAQRNERANQLIARV